MSLSEFTLKQSPDNTWNFEYWKVLELELRAQTTASASEKSAWRLIVADARRVMRTYTTSFFIVSRFLPPLKRDQVEIIYSAVRYPDEVVDTFPLSSAEKLRLLDCWQAAYETGLATTTLGEALSQNVPCFLAAFTKVVREKHIPAEYYRSFLDAMRRDVRPRHFSTLDDLIDNYVYGSAVVVGYFLTYVYGAKTEKDFQRAMQSARELGIALQLTNFLRDIGEDQKRGRIYLPLEMLRKAGIETMDVADHRQHPQIARVISQLGAVADDFYASALTNLDAFAPDCHTAVYSCISVYRRLNERIRGGMQSIVKRESVPLWEKFRVLPISKYWRIPYAYLIR